MIFSKSHTFWLKKLKKFKMARSTGVRNPPKLLLTKELLMYLFSFLWNEILVLIFNMVIYMQRLAIQFVEMHCTRMHKLFIDQHPGSNCILFIELFTNRHVSAIKKITTVSLFLLLQFDYEIWEIIIYSTTSVFDICSILVSYKESIEVGHIFFCWRLHKCCGIRPKHSNISKRVEVIYLLQFMWY